MRQVQMVNTSAVPVNFNEIYRHSVDNLDILKELIDSD